MILVAGATGTVGRLVAQRLSGSGTVRLLVRAPYRAPVPDPGTETVVGDFDDPGSLREALTGVRSALLVTMNPLAPAQDENFLTAARAARVAQVVKLSAQAVTDADATDLVTRWQRDNEELLRASGLPWTLLRPRAFMSNTLGWTGSVRREGVVRAPHGSLRNATVDPRDIADVAVRALTEPARHEGHAYALTGPEALTPARQTEILAELLQKPLAFEELTSNQMLRELLRRYPAPVAHALVESAERGRNGTKARVDPTVAELLGRPAGTYRDWAAAHLDAFRA
ncbi:NAD(P)H-binding protein [Streptomyces sp. NPDC050997]|uniref:NAD(P)H-binding protein n=1 Tax=Streptomyces sp. NPDC050997 TaxID=3155519 RepID=UPI003439F603